MTTQADDLPWRGTSDSPAVLRQRAAIPVKDRLAWLDEALDHALASGALALDRARRQREADAWAAEHLPRA